VGVGESPFFGVVGEVGGHVFVKLFLQVDILRSAEGADDDVGADAGGWGDVAVGVIEFAVGGIVSGGHTHLRAGGGDEVGGGGGRSGEGSKGDELERQN